MHIINLRRCPIFLLFTVYDGNVFQPNNDIYQIRNILIHESLYSPQYVFKNRSIFAIRSRINCSATVNLLCIYAVIYLSDIEFSFIIWMLYALALRYLLINWVLSRHGKTVPQLWWPPQFQLLNTAFALRKHSIVSREHTFHRNNPQLSRPRDTFRVRDWNPRFVERDNCTQNISPFTARRGKISLAIEQVNIEMFIVNTSICLPRTNCNYHYLINCTFHIPIGLIAQDLCHERRIRVLLFSFINLVDVRTRHT